MVDFMTDLETASTRTNAVILSIGCVKFDLLTEGSSDPFYVNVSMEDCIKYGLHVCPNTLKWWESQSEEAKAALKDPEPIPLYDALFQFRAYVKMNSGKNRTLWGNGATFDNMILASAYEAVGMKFPFHFTQHRDVRTLVHLGRRLGLNEKRAGEFEGTPHNALDDASHQARYCTRIARRIQKKANE